MRNTLSLLFFFVITTTFAQQSYGVKIGLQTTGITNAQKGDNQNQYGAYVGGFYSIKMKDKFSFQPELMYSFQSFNNVNISPIEYSSNEASAGETQPRFDEKYQLHLIKLPLLLKYQPNKLFVEIGPELSYIVSSRLSFTDKENEILNTKGKIQDINNFQAGLIIGGGYQLDEKLDLGLRATWGLTKLSDDSYIKNFNVGIGISYKLK